LLLEEMEGKMWCELYSFIREMFGLANVWNSNTTWDMVLTPGKGEMR